MDTENKELETPVTRSIVSAIPENHGKLGKRIEIGSTAHASVNKPGMKLEFFTPTIDVLIGIGDDHVAYLVMDVDAWEALKAGGKEGKQNITSLKQFTKKFL